MEHVHNGHNRKLSLASPFSLFGSVLVTAELIGRSKETTQISRDNTHGDHTKSRGSGTALHGARKGIGGVTPNSRKFLTQAMKRSAH